MNEHEETVRLLSLRNTMMIVYTVLAAVMFVVTCFFLIHSKNTALKAQSENYVTVAIMQSARSVDNFCENIEQASGIVYETTEYVNFYPKGDELTAEELEIKQKLSDNFAKANYMSDYCDFGVIYSNNTSAGIVSDGTLDLFGDNVYNKASGLLNDRDRCWNVFYSDNVSRICFLKRLNDNAVFIASVYSSRFGHVFGKLSNSSSLSIYVTDRDDKVIYTSGNSDVLYGDPLPYDIISRVSGRKNVTIGDAEGVCTELELSNGWRMYAVVIPDTGGRFGSRGTETFIAIMGLSSLFIFIVTGFFIGSFYLSKKPAPKISEINIDPDTGVLTPFYCEERISDLIEISLVGGTWAFALVKIKDIKLFSERLGEDFARESLKKVADILKSSFKGDPAIGLNEDKDLVVFADFTDFDIFMAHKNLQLSFTELRKKLDNVLVGENEDYRLDIGVAVCIYPDHGRTFEELEFEAKMILDAEFETDNERLVFYDEKKTGGGRS